MVGMKRQPEKTKALRGQSRVASGQPPSIRPIEFASGIHPKLPVEVVERSDLIRRLGHQHFVPPQRPAFDSFLLGRSGVGRHVVDFVETSLRPARLVWVRPGQVQIWDTESEFEATIIVSPIRARPRSGPLVSSNSYRDLDPDSVRAAEDLVRLLRREQKRFAGDDASIGLMNTLFEALSCLFDRARGEETATLPEPYVTFVEAVEKNLGRSHTVRDLARDLGYSERTIIRACRKATGRSAREVLNQRIVLEAKRLLAHTDSSASEIAADLGFSEPTNFHKFFTRHAGEGLNDFRRGYRQAV